MSSVSGADKETEKRLKEMEKHLREIYDRATSDVGKAWTEYMEKANAEVSRLTDAYIKAKESGDQTAIREAGKALAGAKQERTIYNNHYQQLTKDLAENISHVNETAIAYINNQLPEIYSLNYNSVAKGVNKQLGGMVGGTSFDLVDQNAVKRLATRKENLLPLKEVNGKKDIRWNVAKINSEVTQGILQGEAMPKIAERLSNVLGMDKVSAIRNARTTVTSAQNKGRMDMMRHARSKGVIVQKGWSSALDDRTRESHLELDGEFVDEDEPFSNGLMYPGDPNGAPEEVYNCRCSLIYKVVGFGDPQEEEDDPWEGFEDEQTAEPQREFVPAESIKDAEQYISQYVDASGFGAIGVDYTGVGLDAANEVNKTLSNLMETFDVPKFGGITAPAGNTKVGKMMSNATAAYSPVRKSYYLNRKNFKNVATAEKAFQKEVAAINDILTHPEKYDLSRASRQLLKVIENSKVSGRATIPTTIEQVLQHEFGHSLERKVMSHELWSEAAKNMESFAPRLSGYACQDKSEYIAESFCSFMQNEQKADPVLVEIFKSFRR